MKAGSLLLVGAFVLLPRPGAGQGVSVAVEVTDPTGGAVTAAFTAAFEALDQVRVVSEAERPRYILRGVVMCQPASEACAEATGYTMALALVEPLNPVVLGELAQAADSSYRMPPQAAYNPGIWDLTEAYMRLHRLSTTSLRATVFERALKEFVGSLDERCFEKTRLLARWTGAQQEGRFDEAAALARTLAERDWIC